MARTDGAERRAQFIGAAQQLFYTKGYESTSVNDIINAIGVSKGAFYHHFDSKESMLVAVVASLVEQTTAIMEPILDNHQLTAIEKFKQITRSVGDWKSERRDEMMNVMRMMYSNENLHLRHRLNAETGRIAVPVLSRIFEQGINEGVFNLDGIHGEDAAEYVLTLLRTTGEAVIYMMLDPNQPEDAAAIAISKYENAQIMIERILDAPAGSLTIMDYDALAQWFI